MPSFPLDSLTSWTIGTTNAQDMLGPSTLKRFLTLVNFIYHLTISDPML